MLEFRLFGGFAVRLTTGEALAFPRRKAQALLAYLALHPDQVHPRDKLAALLWGGASDARARHSLRQALVALRQALAAAAPRCLTESADGVALDAAQADVDVVVFERLAAETAVESLERAAALYRGPLLEGVGVTDPAFEEWLLRERERLRELALQVLAQLLAHHMRDDPDRAIQTAGRMLALDPAQEIVHRALMRLYGRQGRRGAALRQFQLCMAALRRELGVEPEAATKELYRELLQTPGRAAPDRREPVAVAIASSTPLVGRATELATLRQRLEQAAQDHASVGLIEGEAGIGKTRLVEALVAAAGAAGGQVLVGRARESEQALPLGPWVDAFRLGGIVPDLVGALDPTWRAELARLFPELGAAPHEPAADDYVRLFEAVTRTVQHLASTRPLLIVLEDLHWADEMSLRLVVFLARRIVDAPVLVVGTVRLEQIPDAPTLRRTMAQLARQPRFFSLPLPPLSRAETITLVRGLISGKTGEASAHELGDRVWRASEGNPFMIVETTLALQGPDVAERESDLTPPRVRELITARLERLGTRARRVAAVASVIASDCEFALLERAAELGAGETAEAVEELVARRILHVVGERLDFTHERIRAVAYDVVLPPYRQRLHEVVAHAIEALHGDDLSPYALALGRHHYANRAWDRAAHYLAQAGAIAAERTAHREAIVCFEQALEALRCLPPSRATAERMIDLRFSLRQSCVPLREHQRMLAHVAEAEAQADALGDRGRLGWARAFTAHGRFLSGDAAGAIAAAEEGITIAQALPDPVLEEWANVYLGQALHWTGAYRRSVEVLRRNIALLEPRLEQRGIRSRQSVNSRMFLAWCLAELGEFGDALAAAEQAVAIAEAADSAYWLVHACSGGAFVHLQRGDAVTAVRWAERAAELCGGRDFMALSAMPAAILGPAYTMLGRPGDAITVLEHAATLVPPLAAPVLMFLGEAYLAANRADDAHRVATEGLKRATDGAERGWEAAGLRLLGRVAAAEDVARAEAAYRRGLTLADELGMQPLVAHCHLDLARLYRNADKPAESTEHLSAAIAIFRRLDMPVWLATAERER